MTAPMQHSPWETVRFDAAGLVAVVVQDALTGEVRMLAWANAEALARTRDTGRGHFWSRSRAALWEKGATSGNTLRVVEVRVDCDGDAVLYRVEPEGPSCHTGAASCFYRVWPAVDATASRPLGAIDGLVSVLEARRDAPDGAPSYTRKLLDAGVGAIGAKVREEADELARALADESDARVVSEAVDVLYHLGVGLVARRIPWRAVLAEVARRSGVSGLVEKAARKG